MSDKIRELHKRVDELEKQNEEIARDNLKLMSSNQQFQSRLAKYKEAIRLAWKIAKERASLASREDRRRELAKEFKQDFKCILGSVFDKIISEGDNR